MGVNKLLIIALILISSSFSKETNLSALDYGIIKLRIEPGFIDIRINGEVTVTAQHILLPMGEQKIFILAPRGYNDTTVTVFINDHSILRKDVQLTPEVLLPEEKDNKKLIYTISTFAGVSIAIILFFALK